MSTKTLHYAEWKDWLEAVLSDYNYGYVSLTEEERKLFGHCLLINRHRMKLGEKHFCETSAESAHLPLELVEYWWRISESKIPIKHVVCQDLMPPSKHDVLCAVSWEWFEEER